MADTSPNRPLEVDARRPEFAAAALLARQAKRIASPQTRDAIRALLSDEATCAVLGQDLLARAFALLPGEFSDDADRYLDAFRNAFLADEPASRA